MRKLTDSNCSKSWKHYVGDVNAQKGHVTVEAAGCWDGWAICYVQWSSANDTTHLLQASMFLNVRHCICGRCIETVDEEYRLVDPTVAEHVQVSKVW